jgi:hypothetical protein
MIHSAALPAKPSDPAGLPSFGLGPDERVVDSAFRFRCQGCVATVRVVVPAWSQLRPNTAPQMSEITEGRNQRKEGMLRLDFCWIILIAV